MEEEKVKEMIRSIFVKSIATAKYYSSSIDSRVVSSCMEATGRIVAAMINSEESEVVPHPAE